MEALIAIGLAGNIVQFVQFTSNLISEADSIRKTGNPSSLPDLRLLTDNITKQCDTINRCLNGNAQLSDEDRHLLDISSKCQQSASELLAYLDKLLATRSSSNPIRSAGKVIKLAFSYKKLEDLTWKLDKLRSALILSAILALRSSASTSSEDILIHLRRLERTDQAHGEQNTQLLEAIRALADLQDHSVPGLLSLHEKIEKCLEQLQLLRAGTSKARETEILQWLNFRQMTWRYEEIPLAYQNTFEWIFTTPTQVHVNGWDDFMAHLSQSDTPLYFINGKAGSGKSTLMKYIVNDSRVTDALSHWAENGELIVVNYFFWNLGTELQKTSLGMLRSLLHDVLKQYPELIPGVFSGMYQSWADVGPAKGSQPNIIEVKKAFQRLKVASAMFLKICIFIDGVDEFEGDHRELAEFICSLASNHIKIIVSSRPISVCLNAFDGYPSLRLQDLTAPDIELYIRKKLVAHRPMVALSKRFPTETTELVVELKEKAAGVFLWVTLVVRLLVDGLEAGDDVRDLQRKLRSLPGSLRALYRRMISKMEPDYRVQAAKMFQLLHAWNQLDPWRPFTTILLSFAMQPPSKVFSQQVQPLDADTFQWLCESVEAQVRSRCCGLLDVYSRKPEAGLKYDANGRETEPSHDASAVDYLHRTVAEFLAADDVWRDMCHLTKDSGFDTTLNLASASLAVIKISSRYDHCLLDYVGVSTVLYRTAEAFSDSRTLRRYMFAMDDTMTAICQKVKSHGAFHWSANLYTPVPVEGKPELVQLHRSASLFSFAARVGIKRFLLTCSNEVQSLSGNGKAAIVFYALECWADRWWRDRVPLHTRTDILLYLFENVASPTTRALGHTPWYIVLNHLSKPLQNLLEFPALVAAALTSTDVARDLITEMEPHHKSDLPNLVYMLEVSDDESLRELGRKARPFLRIAEDELLKEVIEEDFGFDILGAESDVPFHVDEASPSSKRSRPSTTLASRQSSTSPPRKVCKNEYFVEPPWSDDVDMRGVRLRESEEILARLG